MKSKRYARTLHTILYVGITALSVEGQQSVNRTSIELAHGLEAAALTRSPACVEVYENEQSIRESCMPYQTFSRQGDLVEATAVVPLGASARAEFQDIWEHHESSLQLHRTVVVHGQAEGGFLSSIQLEVEKNQPRSAVQYFIPGVVYGKPNHLTSSAIGGSDSYGPNGAGTLQIREDRTPAPLAGVYFADGSSITVLHTDPIGTTTIDDAQDTTGRTLIDRNFSFGSVGMHQNDKTFRIGFWYPGSEGEVTYAGNTYPGGQLHHWRRRYHPIEDGIKQSYTLVFRTDSAPTFPDFYRKAWRSAWAALKPPITPQNIPLVRSSLISMLGDRVLTINGRSGIPVYEDAVTGAIPKDGARALLGFVGKNIEAANFLLEDSDLDLGEAGRLHRQQGTAIIDSFVKILPMSPPIGEGFSLVTGVPIFNQPHEAEQARVYLRSLTDDLKSLNKLLLRERKNGREHKEWLAWSRSFADWLLTQQTADGGFPRSWHPGTGVGFDTSEQASYNAVPFLSLMTKLTGDARYRAAAERAAEFTWLAGEREGTFVGGTIDNPDIIDKEAGTLSVEAYLTLYEQTKSRKWLDRAQHAANFAETWIYLWNVPMPLGESDAILPWKNGVPTVGAQLIATGHSLTDEYMSFDTDEFAKLSSWTGDTHDLDVARLLLHDTKNMLAVPGRLYDLKGPGWQQEHWTFSPVRGFGLHRGWLPWVATSQLNGIYGLMEFDQSTFERLASPAAPVTK